MADTKSMDNVKPHETHVPTIDISVYLQQRDNSHDIQGLVDQIRDACVGTGFFQITGHGISRKLQARALDAAKAFFSLSADEKQKLDIKQNVGFRGYDGLGTQAYKADAPPDLKERGMKARLELTLDDQSFFIGTNIPMDDPRALARRILMGPNVWPNDGILPPGEFRAPMEEYYRAVHLLATRVLELIGLALRGNAELFTDYMANEPAAPLRLLHYPPNPLSSKSPGSSDQLGCGPHTDFGSITLLLQDENPGLQVLDTESKSWVTVPPRSDAYVVNVGDMLSLLTGGKFRSSLHRVLRQVENDRYSIAFFIDGNVDYVLKPFDAEGDVTAPTVEQYMIDSIRKSYAPTKADQGEHISTKL